MAVLIDTDPLVDLARRGPGRGRCGDRGAGPGDQRDHRQRDLWIAATGIAHGLSVATRNGADFRRVPGLDVIAIPTTDRR